MRLEKQLMKILENRLSVLRMTGEVINFHRLNSGKVKNIYTNSWINLGDKDNPDWIALIRNRENNITLLYIECKSDTGKLRPGQESFIKRYSNKEDVVCMLLRDIKEFDNWIDKYSKNFVNLLPSEL